MPVLKLQPVYLTGYDVQTFSMRDVLPGTLPATATDGQDPTDAISPQGMLSQDIKFASCAAMLPPAPLERRAWWRTCGRPSPGAAVPERPPRRCAGIARGDYVARGYVTIDTVSGCTARLPHEAGYFAAGGTGDATNQNRLVGDYAVIDGAGGAIAPSRRCTSRRAPRIRCTSTAGSYTFYGRLVGWTAADNREPLATHWAAPYEGADAQVIVWRDPKNVPASLRLQRGAPSWYPLGIEGIVGFDLQESATHARGSRWATSPASSRRRRRCPAASTC